KRPALATIAPRTDPPPSGAAMRRILLAAVVLFAVTPARAEKPQRTHDITVADYFGLAAVTQFTLSPGGKHVAYAEARWQKSTNDRKTDLWLLEIDTKKVRRLTFDRCNASSPRWAPDGKTVYFLARRKRGGEKQPPFDGSNQVWRVGLDGSKIEAAT